MNFTLKSSSLVTLDSVSQYAHVGWGYVFITFPLPFISTRFMWWRLLVCVLGEAGKEYWDSHGLETPEVAGNSWKDWFFWCLGNATGVAALLFRR